MPQKLEQLFGKVIRRRREDADLTQEDLGHGSGLSRNYIGMLERGERSPTIHVLHQLASALGTTMTSLIQELDTAVSLQAGSSKKRGRQT
jgi:transcriptional regulator with XRE-family HTH domain